MKNPRTRFILILGLVLVLAVIAILPSLLAAPAPTTAPTSAPARDSNDAPMRIADKMAAYS